MSQLRVERVQELIKQELSKVILSEMKDPRIGFVTVTQVKMSGDLREGEIFVSLMGTEDEKAATLKALNHSLGYLRTEIGKRVRLRHTPEFHLKEDDSLDYGANIQKLLLQIEREKQS